MRSKSEETAWRRWTFVSLGIGSRETGEGNATQWNLGYGQKYICYIQNTSRNEKYSSFIVGIESRETVELHAI